MNRLCSAALPVGLPAGLGRKTVTSTRDRIPVFRRPRLTEAGLFYMLNRVGRIQDYPVTGDMVRFVDYFLLRSVAEPLQLLDCRLPGRAGAAP